MRLLRRILRELLSSLLELEGFDLAVHFVNAREMTRLNENYLQHAGSTDVITFDYSESRAHPNRWREKYLFAWMKH